VVSPAKTPAQVMQEAAIGSELYKKSHLDYDVGEPSRMRSLMKFYNMCAFLNQQICIAV